MSRYLSPRLIQEMYDIKKTQTYKLLKEFQDSGGKVYKIGRNIRVYDEEFEKFIRGKYEQTS